MNDPDWTNQVSSTTAMRKSPSKAYRLKRVLQSSWSAFAYLIRRKIRKLRRRMKRSYKPPSYSNASSKPRTMGMKFAIVCVKKIEYINMAVDNINSLHYLNDGDSFVIYADTICNEEFIRIKNLLDYPRQVVCNDEFKGAEEPWQKYKVETIIDASQKGLIFTDADGIWHDEPKIDSNKITLLVLANAIKDNAVEKQVVEALFKEQSAVDFNHYVTGFVSIPPALMTDALGNNMRKFTGMLLNDPLVFLDREEDRKNIHRLAEELGVNIAIQAHYKDIATLKQSDGPKNRELLQSLYYGCKNGVID